MGLLQWMAGGHSFYPTNWIGSFRSLVWFQHTTNNIDNRIKDAIFKTLCRSMREFSEQWLYFFWASPASPSAEMCAYREFLFQLVDSAYIKTPYSLPDFGLVTKHESWVNTRISIGLSSLLWLRRQTFCWLFCTTWNLKSPSAAHVCRFAAATV